MKRLIFATIVALSFLAGCGKDETQTKHYIVFRDELGYAETIRKGTPGVTIKEYEVQITLIEYYRNQRANLITIDAPEKGKSYFFKPNKRTEYVTAKVYWYMKGDNGREATYDGYVANAFYIEEDKNTLIVIKPDTQLSNIEPVLR